MRKTGGSFQGGGIKATPTYLANHNGLNSKEVNNIKWQETHSATHVGGSFRGGSTIFPQESGPIIDNVRYREALAKYKQ